MFRLDFREHNRLPYSVRLDCTVLQAMRLARHIRESFEYGGVDVYCNGKWIKEYC